MKSCKECSKYKCNRMLIIGQNDEQAWDTCFFNPANCIGTDKDRNRVFVLDLDTDDYRMKRILTEREEGHYEETIIIKDGQVMERKKKLYSFVPIEHAWNAGIGCGAIPIKSRWQAIVIKEGEEQ
jgi:hypothetical protein